MDNKKRYIEAFVEAFNIDENVVHGLEYEDIPEWDSVGHMVLISELETRFDLTFEMEDILDFSSFERGKEMLKKYDVVV